MAKLKYRELQPTGKCSVCGINLWEEHGNEPAIWPCGLGGCPYPDKPQVKVEHSSIGGSLGLIIYDT